MMFTLHLYREGDRWFFDDPKKNIEHEEFVGGVPDFLYHIAQRNTIKKCDISISTKEMIAGIKLICSEKVDPLGGTYYTQEGTDREIWLCPVFWDYFRPPVAPKTLWILMWDAID